MIDIKPIETIEVLEKAESLIGSTVTSKVLKNNCIEYLEKATGKKWEELK